MFLMPNFKVIAKEGRARVGELQTAHGKIMTPVFMPVGTQASVKALSPEDLKGSGAQIILGNTYHLYLRPGSKLIKKMGGLHKFMNWDGPILTDSGGFQAFSLGAMIEHGVKKVGKPTRESGESKESQESKGVSHQVRKGPKVYREKDKKIIRHVTVLAEDQSRGKLARSTGSGSAAGKSGEDSKIVNTIGDDIVRSSILTITENRENGREKNGRVEVGVLSRVTEVGVEFKSHLDGSKHLLTPESSIGVQLDLGSDIVLVLDELLSPLHDYNYVKQSLERTHRWELRSKDYFNQHLNKGTNKKALLFGILQGVYDKEIRQQEAKWIAKQGFSGISVGGSFGTSEIWGNDSVDWAAAKAIKETFSWVTPLLPEDLPRHGLGIGEVQNLFDSIEEGVDMFDCVSPTRRARNGSLYVSPKNGGNIKKQICSFHIKCSFRFRQKTN